MARKTSREKTKDYKFLIGLGDLVDRLSIVNIKISILESIVKNHSKTDEDAGKAARLIRKLNIERLALKGVLNKWYKEGYEDVKVEYYELFEKVKKEDRTDSTRDKN